MPAWAAPMSRRLRIIARCVNGCTFTVVGRDAWALCELIMAGERGCTPIDNPGPRWSAYVHALRTEHRLAIETVDERHGGQFAGTHARYILRELVEVIAYAGDQDQLAKCFCYE